MVQEAVKDERPNSRLGKETARKVARAINRGDTDAAQAILKERVKGVGDVRAKKIVDNAAKTTVPTEAYDRIKHYG